MKFSTSKVTVWKIADKKKKKLLLDLYIQNSDITYAFLLKDIRQVLCVTAIKKEASQKVIPRSQFSRLPLHSFPADNRKEKKREIRYKKR